MKVIVATAVTLVLASAPALSQAPQMKPGPEHKRIGYFAGTWTFQGEAKQSPIGPAGKISSSETCEWLAGGFQLSCRSKGTGPRGASIGRKPFLRFSASLNTNVWSRTTVVVSGSKKSKVETSLFEFRMIDRFTR